MMAEHVKQLLFLGMKVLRHFLHVNVQHDSGSTNYHVAVDTVA